MCNVSKSYPIQRSNPLSTVKIDDVPHYMQNNTSILTVYRPSLNLTLVFLSAFRLQNETVNIWSHAIAAALNCVPLYRVVKNLFRKILFLCTYDFFVLVCFICSPVTRSVRTVFSPNWTTPAKQVLLQVHFFSGLIMHSMNFVLTCNCSMYMLNALVWCVVFVIVTMFINCNLTEY